jgi:hypothetical protein
MSVRECLRKGLVIPAHPRALTPDRRLDERRQRALTRYYLAAGAGGIAVAVHTTQFAIRDPQVGLLKTRVGAGHRGSPQRRRCKGGGRLRSDQAGG